VVKNKVNDKTVKVVSDEVSVVIAVPPSITTQPEVQGGTLVAVGGVVKITTAAVRSGDVELSMAEKNRGNICKHPGETSATYQFIGFCTGGWRDVYSVG